MEESDSSSLEVMICFRVFFFSRLALAMICILLCFFCLLGGFSFIFLQLIMSSSFPILFPRNCKGQLILQWRTWTNPSLPGVFAFEQAWNQKSKVSDASETSELKRKKNGPKSLKGYSIFSNRHGCRLGCTIKEEHQEGHTLALVRFWMIWSQPSSIFVSIASSILHSSNMNSAALLSVDGERESGRDVRTQNGIRGLHDCIH